MGSVPIVHRPAAGAQRDARLVCFADTRKEAREAYMGKLDDRALAQLFTDARTHFKWHDREVPDALLRELHDLVKMGPTSANCCPMRVVFVRTDEGKARLRPCLMQGNVDKTMSAPVTAIIAFDSLFYTRMHELFPDMADEARSWWEGEEKTGSEHGFRNGTLQGGYFILAARALGLDCGPMSGFDADAVNSEFFPDGRFKANFLCNLGYGDPSVLHPRLPRFDFDDVCQVV